MQKLYHIVYTACIYSLYMLYYSLPTMYIPNPHIYEI